MHLACRSGNTDLVKYLISLKEIDINAKTVFILNIFLYNFFYYYLNEVCLFVNEVLKNFIYRSILFSAIKSGNIELVKYLIALGKFDLKETGILLFNYIHYVFLFN